MSLDEFDEVNQDAAVAPKKKMTVEKFFQQFNRPLAKVFIASSSCLPMQRLS